MGILGTRVRKLLIYSMCLMGLGRFWAKFQLVMAHIQSMLLNVSGMRGSGTGDGEPSPSPLDPMGIDFPPFSSPWGIKSPHPRPLIGEFPTGNRGSGPRCHLEGESWAVGGKGAGRGGSGPRPAGHQAEGRAGRGFVLFSLFCLFLLPFFSKHFLNRILCTYYFYPRTIKQHIKYAPA